MTFALPCRVCLVGVVCALSLGCSDDAATRAATRARAAATAAHQWRRGGQLPNMTAGTSRRQQRSSGSTSGGGALVEPRAAPAAWGAYRSNAGPRRVRRADTRRDRSAASWAHGRLLRYVPPHYGTRALPVLVFRHGVGENGNGTTEWPSTGARPPKLIEANQCRRSQVRRASVQHTAAAVLPDRDGRPLQFALDNYDIDPKRVYLTGLSCGASAPGTTW